MPYKKAAHTMTATKLFSFNPELLALLQEDPDFKAEITRLFEEDGLRLLQELESALEADDLKTVGETAHALKGIFSNTGIQELWHIAAELDTLAKDNQIHAQKTKAVTLFLSLKNDFQHAVTFVNTL
jgi:HPt (histidine-containing phosphotransfer) domain-containing protein